MKYGMAMFDGFQLVDCAVTATDSFIFSFVHAQEYASEDCAVFSHAATKKLVKFTRGEKGWKIGSKNIKGTEVFHAAAGAGKGQGFFVDGEGLVFISNANGIAQYANLSAALPNAGYVPVSAIKSFAGLLCGCGPDGTLFRFSVENGWEYIAPPLRGEDGARREFPAVEGMLCLDIDGFAADDIYVVGGVGKLCHFNGEDWRDISFPSNYRLSAVCCGGDGLVYVGALGGTVFMGRGDSWAIMRRDALALPFKDMVWFRDTLWCANDYGLWALRESGFAPMRLTPAIDACAGRLAVGHGQMLMGGAGGVAVFEEDYCYPLFELNWQDTLDYEAIGT